MAKQDMKDEEKLSKKPYEGKETEEEEEEETKKATSEEEDMEKSEGEEEEEKCKKKKKMKKKEDEDEEKTVEKADDEEEMEKAEENPEESAKESTNASHSTSPNFGVPSRQDVFTPASNVHVGRESSSGSSLGQSPSEVHYKSGNADLTKSPLFVGLSKQLKDLAKSFDTKMEAVEKSMQDRIMNMEKSVKHAEAVMQKFYDQPFYKSQKTDAVQEIKTMSKQVQEGNVHYSM